MNFLTTLMMKGVSFLLILAIILPNLALAQNHQEGQTEEVEVLARELDDQETPTSQLTGKLYAKLHKNMSRLKQQILNMSEKKAMKVFLAQQENILKKFPGYKFPEDNRSYKERLMDVTSYKTIATLKNIVSDGIKKHCGQIDRASECLRQIISLKSDKMVQTDTVTKVSRMPASNGCIGFFVAVGVIGISAAVLMILVPGAAIFGAMMLITGMFVLAAAMECVDPY
ncbi:MAG: hypothetical protein ACOYL6_13085 [Bacteriovoracaceae bacterium]